jgi:uncharacterized protein (TIGR02266 family)
MSAEEAMQTLQCESGNHFEPRIVDAFVSYLEKNTVCMLNDQNGIGQPQLTRQPRIDYRTQVSAKIDRRTISGASVDISLGGLFVNAETSVDIPPGTEITITFNLPSHSRPIQVTGKVIWVNAGEPRPAQRLPKGFGVHFKNISGEIRAALHEHIEKYLRQAGQFLGAP